MRHWVLIDGFMFDWSFHQEILDAERLYCSLGRSLLDTDSIAYCDNELKVRYR
jgi:hypothetical protein